MTSPLPVAIGGLGGSGTRAAAKLISRLGYYLGADLNEALDNLWFTLIFKRRSILLEKNEQFSKLSFIFFAALQGRPEEIAPHLDLISQLAAGDRLQHSQQWLAERVKTLAAVTTPASPPVGWGWKEPNTHIVIDKLLLLNEDLRYIHVLRHPHYMAHSRNQNQLANWGPIFFSRDIEITPENSLTYWRLSHQKILALRREWPGRIMIIRFEDLVTHPASLATKLADFLATHVKEEAMEQFKQELSGAPLGTHIPHYDLSAFHESDVKYADRYWDDGAML